MDSPVFVIHGIGVRDPEAFRVRVDTLARAAHFDAHPVFWGDLGARTALIERTVPAWPEVHTGEETSDEELPLEVCAVAKFLAGMSSAAEPQTRGGDAMLPHAVLEAALEVLNAGSAAQIRDMPGTAEIERTLRDEWPQTEWLAIIDDPRLLKAVGMALTGPLAEGDALLLGNGEPIRVHGAWGIDIGGFIKRRLKELDRVVGAAFGAAGGRVNSHLRSSMLPEVTQCVGDVLVYQRHQDVIQARVWETLANVAPELGSHPERPVDIVAHSLGGVIAVDMATAARPLWIRRLVTFGSQSPFFHVCDPRGGRLKPFDGAGLVQLPPSLGAWTNLWEPLDVLAFIAAKVFQLNDGAAPDDRAVPHLISSGIWSHSAYWHLDSVAENIAAALNSRP